MIGTIRLWKGPWGFIATRAYPQGVFLHRDAVQVGEPAKGRRVRFKVRVEPLGPKAVEACILSDEEVTDGDGL